MCINLYRTLGISDNEASTVKRNGKGVGIQWQPELFDQLRVLENFQYVLLQRYTDDDWLVYSYSIINPSPMRMKVVKSLPKIC